MGRLYRPESHHSIPIVNDRCEIVGWTDNAPGYVGPALRHPEAEELVGPVTCLYIEIERAEDARKAGAPPEWRGPWRCLALCSVSLRPDDPERVRAVVRASRTDRDGKSAPEPAR